MLGGSTHFLKSSLLGLASLQFVLSGSLLAEIVRDDFNRPDGPLVGSTPNVGSIWRFYRPGTSLEIKDGAVDVNKLDTQEVYIGFSAITAQEVYYSYDLTVTDVPSDPWIFTSSFLGAEGPGFSDAGRIFVSSSPLALHFRIGIDNYLDNPIWWPVDLVEGETYRVVIGFNENGATDSGRMWIDPACTGSPYVTEPLEDVVDDIQGFILNLGHFSESGKLLIDNLLITTDPSEAFPLGICDEPELSISAVTYDPLTNLVEFDFNGIPGRQYSLEDSTNLEAWDPYFTFTADGDGHYQFLRRFPETALENYYFRVKN